MIMLRPSGKPYKISKEVLKQKGIKVPKPKSNERVKNLQTPYLQH